MFLLYLMYVIGEIKIAVCVTERHYTMDGHRIVLAPENRYFVEN